MSFSTDQMKSLTFHQHSEETPEVPWGRDNDLIGRVNNLQAKLINNGFNLDLPLPQIVVIGPQSAGKSSVLENIVGREFLPRGYTLVTRRPTLIQLYPTASEEYAVFGHDEGVKFTDFEEVKEELAAQMPAGKSFSSVPILLKIFSPSVLKLTLVDLPGLVSAAVDGQSESCIEEVRTMVQQYISQPECLILVVTPANQELALCDALQMAKKVDPERSRTIGVLTKLDIMDEGTDALDVLENRQVSLKRGWVGVMNRSQRDIDEGKDIQFILNKEKNFFATKDCYRHLADRMGIPYLRRSLQRILKSHIKAALPGVRTNLAEKLLGYQKLLKEFESNMGENSNGKQFYIIKLVNTFIQDIHLRLIGNSERVSMMSLSAGAYIYCKLNTEVQNLLNLKLKPKEEHMAILITNLHGFRGSLAFNDLAVDAINKQLLSEYETPLEKTVDCVKCILEQAIAESSTLMNRYASTKAELLYRINRCIRKEAENTKAKLREHLQAEMSYINLQHPDLDLTDCTPLAPPVAPSKVWQTPPDGAAPPDSTTASEPSTMTTIKNTQIGVEDDLSEITKPLVKILMTHDSTQKKVQYLMHVITKYLEIVQKQILDLTIKYILYFLVKKVLDYTNIDLIPTLLGSSNFASLTEDCEEDFRRKKEMETACICLQDALDSIQNF